MENSILKSIDWAKTPLLPAIAQDGMSGEVLMLAYMNEEALSLTIETGFAHYYSRSKHRIWKKGEESGHTQEVKEILLDCDSDSILLKIVQNGVACHTGRASCFYKNISSNSISNNKKGDISEKYSVVDVLYHTICDKKSDDHTTSYTAKLFKKGENAILKKVAEEAGEFILAVKDKNKGEIVYECADLVYHSLVALAYSDINPDLVKQELKRREGMSGIAEKNSRKE